MITANGRSAAHSIDPLFLERWSPRSFTGERISPDELALLFEAARWAPSSSNQQPWRFLYAERDGSDWPLFFDLLTEGNKRWAKDAAALIAVVSKTIIDARDDKPARENASHSFDCGAAWACLALQATRSGWVAHAMNGFDRPRSIVSLEIPDGYHVETMVAVGRYAPQEPPARPNGRSDQATFVVRGVFPKRG